VIPETVIVEADDGIGAVEAVKAALNSGGTFDFILMDYVMVTTSGSISIVHN
jgi:hypothetical protein